MNSGLGISQIRNVQYGTAQKQFNICDAVNFLYPFPSYKEQTAIANVLSDVGDLITSLEKLITKKRAIKTAAMQQLLTGKKRLPPFDLAHTGYKQTELGEIPKDWDIKSIGRFCSCFSGGTPSTSVASYYGGGIPWITSGDLNKGRIKSVTGRITVSGLENSSAKKVSSNTLLFALYGATAGVSAITDISAAINQAVLAIQPDKSSDKAFLFQVLRLRKDYLIDTYTQGGQPNFSGNIVKSFLIALPSIVEEQTAIANVLSDMDKEIDTLEQRLNKTQQLKQGMMQELLTGRTRLI
jgi:type I restriction enzyme S subunit